MAHVHTAGCLRLFLLAALQRSTSVSGNVQYAGEVKVGILHSLTGTMSISEITVVNAERMAIDEINQAGGLLGKEIVPIIEDGESDWDVFAQKAEEFTNPNSSKYVKVVFGCWTSASRKKVLPVFETNDHMLFYPVQYEGQECSKNIFYTGAAPNQQIEPAVDWLVRYKGKRFFLVGSNYTFPWTANEIIRGQLSTLGGTVVGERYLALGDSRNETVGAIVDEIRRTLPTGGVIFNTLNGDSNVKFFHMFYDAGLRADTHPTMSVSITETEIAVVGVQYLIGHYAAWNYFMSTAYLPHCEGGFDPTASKKFVDKYRALYGNESLVNDPMESAYIGVHLWAQAVALAGTFNLEPVRRAVEGQAFPAPEGEVVMRENHHISKFVRLGQVEASGDFRIIYTSTQAVVPEPWNQFVESTKGYACDWHGKENSGFYPLRTMEVALVHALSGPREAAERQQLEAELVAIKDVNREGGVLGRTLLPKVIDTGSSEAVALQVCSEIANDAGGPVAIVGNVALDADYEAAVGGTRTPGVGPPLLLSPAPTLGGQSGEHVLHFGGTANQLLLPAVEYFSQRARAGGAASQNFSLVGSQNWTDDMLNSLKSHIEALGDSVVSVMAYSNGTSGRRLQASVAGNFTEIVSHITGAMPAGGVVINVLGDVSLTVALLQEMANQGVLAGTFPVLSSVAETDIDLFQLADGKSLLSNQYVSLPYLSTVETSAGVAFLKSMAQWYGPSYKVVSSMESAYVAVRYWAQAVEAAGGVVEARGVQHQMWEAPFNAPSGLVQLNESNYLSKPSRVATLDARGTGFRAVAGDAVAVHPEPWWLFPAEKSSAQTNFAGWLRTICRNGQGLVNKDNGSLENWTDAVSCDWCRPGTHSVPYSVHGQVETRACRPCPAGAEQPFPSQDTCDLCGKGLYSSLQGQTGCSACPRGRYADSTSSLECKSCNADPASTDDGALTTLFPSAEDPEQCICPAEHFMQLGTCERCPPRMTCAIGCDARYFPGQGAAPCPDLPGLTCKYPEVEKGYMTMAEDPLTVWSCDGDARCPGGAPGRCAARLAGRACQQSEPGWVWNGRQSSECTALESSGLLFPALPLLLVPVVVVLLYRLFGDTYERWGSWRNGIASVGFIILNHYQVITVIRSCNVNFPPQMVEFLDVFTFSTSPTIFFRPACAGVQDFGTSLIIQACTPLLVFAAYLLTWQASQLVAKQARNRNLAMEKNRTLNGFFSLMFTFFAGITEMALVVFKCADNPLPNKKMTLLADRSLICFEGEWQRYTVVGIAAFLLWVVGFGGLFARTVYSAPQWFAKTDMRMRWKFLFIKFRLDTHFWALVIVAKNIVLNIGFTFLTTGVWQLYYIMFVLILYSGGVIFCRPWRHMIVNSVDIVAQFGLLAICSVGTWFGAYSLEDPHTLDAALVNLGMGVGLICLPLALPPVLFVMWQQLSQTGLDQKQSDIELWTYAGRILSTAGQEDFQIFMDSLSEFDFWFCAQASRIILTEFKGYKMRVGLTTVASSYKRMSQSMREHAAGAAVSGPPAEAEKAPGGLHLVKV